MMLTLWDLIDPLLAKIAPRPRPKPAPPRVRIVVQAPARRGRKKRPAAVAPSPAAPVVVNATEPVASPPAALTLDPAASMQARYDAVVQHMLDKYQIRVRKWRGGMSGVAWYVTYRDGRRVNLIESPRPKGPMSVAVFLHEIGHHAIGFDVYKPRCLEEYHAWRFSLEAMQQHGLNITDQVRYRMHMSLWYAVQKARRRGIKQIPAELLPFLEKIPKPKQTRERL